MDASLTPEQQLLAETVGAAARRFRAQNTPELQGLAIDALWQQLADLGLLGLMQPESRGGAGSAIEVMIVAQELARNLIPVPYLGGVLGLELVAAGGATEDLLVELIDGRRRFTIALDPSLRSVARPGQREALVWDAAGADGAVVVDTDGRPTIVEVTGERPVAADLSRQIVRLASSAAPVLRAQLAPLTADQALAWEALALTLLSADLLGVMDGALDAAIEYTKQRVQFDSKIGSFQAVQHICADAHVRREAARSITWYAAWASTAAAPEAALMASRCAKAFASEAAVQVLESVIQVYGGIAITWETLPHVYLRRALMARQVLGDETTQYEAIAGHRLGRAA